MDSNTRIKWLSTDEVKPYPNNPRHNDDAVEYVANSIREFGWQQPIVVDVDGTIIAGHTRLKAAKRLGMDRVPVVVADNLTPAQVNAYRIADNSTSDAATWDMEALSIELDGLQVDFDMGDFGVDVPEVAYGEEKLEIVEDEAPEDAPQVVKPGEIWQLGRHRLMCGDTTDANALKRLMNGTRAKLLLTDPPYGINADKGFSGSGGFSGHGKPIERRHYKDEWDSERPDKETFDLILPLAYNDIIFGGNFFADELPVGNHWLVWDKHNTMPTFSDAELAWTNVKRNSVKIYNIEWNGLIGKEKDRFHPTQKPIRLFAAILGDYTEEKDVVADFFGGSGSTLIACEQLDRTCYMMEIDPHYCDVIIERWQNLTGEKAVKIGG